MQFIGPIRCVHQSGCPPIPIPALPHQKEGAWNWASGCKKAEGLWLNLAADISDLAPWISKQFWQWDAWKLITPFSDPPPPHTHIFTHMQHVSLPLWGVGSVYIRLITGQGVAGCVHTHLLTHTQTTSEWMWHADPPICTSTSVWATHSGKRGRYKSCALPSPQAVVI